MSDRRQLANRTNASKSTGPQTDSGKAVVSTNAIKHGISDLADGGDINLKIYQDEELVIRVENTGKLKDESGGTGLKNALERLKLLCSPMASLKLFEMDDRVVAEIVIPQA